MSRKKKTQDLRSSAEMPTTISKTNKKTFHYDE